MFACWKNFTDRPSNSYYVLLVSLCILHLSYFPIVTCVSTEPPDPFDFDASGKRVTYYPDSLMLSHNPHAVIFYRNTKLLHVYIDLRTPPIGRDFTINNTCDRTQTTFLQTLLIQLRTIQKSTQRLLSAHGYTSLIECESYLRRYYQYSTGLTPTMTCPYAYKKSLQLCKAWALTHCSRISSHERSWLQGSRRGRRSLPWQCTAGLGNLVRYFYQLGGGNCDSNDLSDVWNVLKKVSASMALLHDEIRTVNGKTIYLMKISDKLVAKVNGLIVSLRAMNGAFRSWRVQLNSFASRDNCHYNNFMEFLSKFSLETTRAFSSLLRFLEISDVLQQTRQLHKKPAIGLNDLPSFVSSEIQVRLHTIPPLVRTAEGLDSGFPLLLDPMIDYDYDISRALGVRMLFTVPVLSKDFSTCTIEYLSPIKYNVSGTCYTGPITRDQLALLRCENSEFLIHENLLAKCALSDYTFVCPDHILRLVSDTTWLGLPWTRGSKLVFSRNHVKAQDCSQLEDLHHLGGRNYLSTQHGILTLRNKTGGVTHTVPLSPLIVYHFPCDLEFSTQRTGFGSCPDRISTHIPLFTDSTFRYVPWERDNYALLDLHYKSLNISPPLVLNKSTLQSLDKTYHLLDNQLDTQLATLQHDVANVRSTPHRRTLPDLCLYISFSLTIANTIALIVFCYRSRKRLPNQSLSWFPFTRTRRLPKAPSDGDRSDQVIEETELATFSPPPENRPSNCASTSCPKHS